MIPLHVLVQRVVEDTDLDPHTVNTVIRAFMNNLKDALVRDGIVRLDGLGRFTVTRTEQKSIRNLVTHGRKKIEAVVAHQYKVFFKKAPTFSASLKQERGGRHARRQRRDGEVRRRRELT